MLVCVLGREEGYVMDRRSVVETFGIFVEELVEKFGGFVFRWKT